jgi:hypothetical protein
VAGLGGAGRAADTKDAHAILDKAIKALGGEQKLSNIKAASWNTKGTITFGGNDNPVKNHVVVQGLDHSRREFEGEFNGNTMKGIFVLAGNKGWRKFGDNGGEIEEDRLPGEKRNTYLAVIPITIVPLKSKDFKVETIGEEKVDGKPAVGIKATGPDGKEFKLYFDAQSGLPVKLVAKVASFMGDEVTQETTFHDYKEMSGIQKATKVQAKRDGEKFLDEQITDFKILDKVDPKTFTEPQ